MAADGPSAQAGAAIPVLGDLPGEGWQVVELPDPGRAGNEPAELLDCVGPDFPRGNEVRASASSAHFLRRRQLVHGIGVAFASVAAAGRAAEVLRGAPFAACLGRSVAADLAADPHGAEVLGVEVAPGGPPQRVSFAGVSSAGALTVHLDIVVVDRGPVVSLVWFGDAPDPFPGADRRQVVARLSARIAAPGPAG